MSGKSNRSSTHSKFVDLYGPSYNHIYLYGPVNMSMASRLRQQIEELEQNIILKTDSTNVMTQPNPVLLHINSYGGLLEAALVIIRLIKSAKIAIDTVVDGFAMSAGGAILMAGRIRYAFPLSIVLLHQHSDSKDVSRQEDHVSMGEYSQALFRQYKLFYMANSKLTDKEASDLLLRDKFLDAKECLKIGIIDVIISAAKVKMNLDTENILEPYNYNTVHISSSELQSDTAKSSDASPLFFVQQFHAINRIHRSLGFFGGKSGAAFYSGQPLPIRLLYDSYFFQGVIATIPILNAILNSVIPVTSFIESNCENVCLLICLCCQKRFMNPYGILQFDFRYTQDSNDKLQDTFDNSILMRRIIHRIFSTRTRLPKAMLDQLFLKQFILTPKDALRYGIVDMILADKHHKSPSIKYGSLSAP